MLMLTLAESSWGALLFENPWPLVIAALAASSVLRITGKRAERRVLVAVSWGALALGLGVYAVAAWVNTDREQVVERSNALIAAASPPDAAALGALFADDLVLLGPQGGLWQPLDAAYVADRLDHFEIREHGLRGPVPVEAARGPTREATIEVASRVQGFPVRTTWRLVWRQRPPSGWELTSLQWLTVNGQPPAPGLYR